MITERMQQLAGVRVDEATGNKFFAYRYGKNPKLLAGRNAGNIAGLVYFLRGTNPRWDASMLITKYEVTNLGAGFEKYEQLNYAFSKSVKHTPDPEGELIGTEKFRYSTMGAGQWYSFPVNGAWDYKVVKTLKIKKVHDQMKKELGRGLVSDERTSKFMTISDPSHEIAEWLYDYLRKELG